MSVYIGEVLSVTDSADGCRAKVRLLNSDLHKPIDKIPYAFPLLPKTFYVKPKVGEAVLVFCSDDDEQNSQRFYLGPLISQPQFLKYDSFIAGGTTLLKNALRAPKKAPSLNPNTHGCFANDEDVAVYGRGNTDLILSENDLKLRCGARQFKLAGTDFEMNKLSPAFLKLTQHDTQLSDESKSSAILAADNICIVSNNGNPNFNLSDSDEQVSIDEINKMIDKAHVLPYGDILVDFLTMFLQMFKSHTHKYNNMPPCPDDVSKKMDIKYGTGTGAYDVLNYDYTRGTSNGFEDASKTFSGLGEKLLSKHVRIN